MLRLIVEGARRVAPGGYAGRTHGVTLGVGEHSMSKTFVLIHGSWHGGWAWQAVIRDLAAKGFQVHAPTLPGHGPRAMREGITHQGCVDTVVTYIQQHRLKDIILVGHSFGGSV